MFADSKVLVTGGTGSFGKALIGRLLSLDTPPRRIVIFSRDELKQYEMSARSLSLTTVRYATFWGMSGTGTASSEPWRESMSWSTRPHSSRCRRPSIPL